MMDDFQDPMQEMIDSMFESNNVTELYKENARLRKHNELLRVVVMAAIPVSAHKYTIKQMNDLRDAIEDAIKTGALED